MDLKLQKRKCFQMKQNHKLHKSNAKGYWNSEVQDLWDETCTHEKNSSQINIVLIIRYLNKNIVHHIDSLISSVENGNENIL